MRAQCEQCGEAARAAESLQRALALTPNFPEAHFNLGKALAALQRFDEAIAEYKEAIAQKPQMSDAVNNLGIALCGSGRVEEGIAQYREALRREPRQTRALNNLGNALRSQGKLKEAESAYRQALTLDPSDAEIWSNLAAALDTQERFDEALDAFERAVTIRPAFSQAHNNAGNTLKNLGDVEGRSRLISAIDLDPNNQAAHSNRLYTMYFLPGCSAERIREAHRVWNAQHAAALGPASSMAGKSGGARGRLRVGYVAPNFRDHCQSFFTVPLLKHHDRRSVEVFAYGDVLVPDVITAQIRGCVDVWRNTCGLSDSALADLVRADGIDVLVDLSLHMADNRLLVFGASQRRCR